MEASNTTDMEPAPDRRLTVASGDDDGQRLDVVLATHHTDLSRTRLKSLIEHGSVAIDDIAVTAPSRKVTTGEQLAITVPPPEPAVPAPEAIPLNVLYEDDELIVLNKPAGMVVHPGAGQHHGTLVNALLHHAKGQLSGIGGVARPGIVHRLDKDTSGVMVVAKTDLAHRSLSKQFADHGRTGALQRQYEALVWGAPRPSRGTIETGLGRDANHPIRMSVRNDGKHAITHYETVGTFAGTQTAEDPAVAHLKCRLETGRTHQIRVHLNHIGHPLLGDPLYGTGYRTKSVKLTDKARAALDQLGRQALHAATLTFEHPVSREILEFSSLLPADIAALISALEAEE
ncbi:MAG: RluA family pseudouridine synthase [Pseudomonadota bacterium]